MAFGTLEPIAYDNIAGYAQLTRELNTSVQLGENFYGPRDMYQAIVARAGDYMMPDLMRIGGVSGWLRSVPIAGAAGVQVSSSHASDGNRPLGGMAGLGKPDLEGAFPGARRLY